MPTTQELNDAWDRSQWRGPDAYGMEVQKLIDRDDISSELTTLREQVRVLRECIDTSLEYIRQHGAEGDGMPAIQDAETILVDALAATEPKETT